MALSSSGASDVTYHIQWIILFTAVDDYGIREQNDLVRTASPGGTNAPSHEDIEAAKKRLYDDTLHGACRIAGLAGVLTSHGYMVRTTFQVLSLRLFALPAVHHNFKIPRKKFLK